MGGRRTGDRAGRRRVAPLARARQPCALYGRGRVTQAGWRGGTNLGGGDLRSPHLLDVQAAGVYLVPPAAADGTLPGADVFAIR